ncbi:MAG: hypothetical protein KatS3mg110_2663 [Pirellulaceae bacterium]|nr:MAG: hypothetical protein KatS3mg110_2663 [Pirellulaceae bacterium]
MRSRRRIFARGLGREVWAGRSGQGGLGREALPGRSCGGWVVARNGRRLVEFVLRDAVTKSPRNNGARHYGPRAKYGARQYGFAPKNEVPGTTPTKKVVPGTTVTAKSAVPGTTVLPAGPLTDTTLIADYPIRQDRYIPGARSPRQPQYRSEKPQREAPKTNCRLLQATTDKTLTPQPLPGC